MCIFSNAKVQQINSRSIADTGKKKPVGNTQSSVANQMGIGTANGANSVRSQFEEYECETLCEASPGAAMKDTWATGPHESNTEWMQKQTDTRARQFLFELLRLRP